MDSRHLEQEEPDIQDMAAMLQELRRLAVAVKFEEGRVHRKARRMLVVVGQRHPNQDRQPVHCGLHNTGMSICPQKSSHMQIVFDLPWRWWCTVSIWLRRVRLIILSILTRIPSRRCAYRRSGIWRIVGITCGGSSSSWWCRRGCCGCGSGDRAGTGGWWRRSTSSRISSLV